MRKRIVLAVIVPSLVAGCMPWQETASTAKPAGAGAERRAAGPSPAVRAATAEKLVQARELLDRGDTAAAEKLLTAICNGRPVPGVTDEALFRLALLSLRQPAERVSTVTAHQLLRRLAREYPASAWSVQAEPLTELLSVVEELRRQNRNLKSANQSLAADKDSLNHRVDELDGKVRQLNKNLEQLKSLDLELERKTR